MGLSSSTPETETKVAVVGAGGAGLAAGRFLREAGLQVKIFEKQNNIGGLWKYREGGPVYKSLVTNLPKQIMQFLDFPFDDALPSFVTHSDMYAYLQKYAKCFELESLVHLNTEITSVKRSSKPSMALSDYTSWDVVSFDNKSGDQIKETYDAVVICNGHYDLPSIPDIPGLEKFPGSIMHSVQYDVPQPFEGKRVLCIGARASGTDVAREISSVAKTVHVCDKDCNEMETGGEHLNICRWPAVKCFHADGAVEFIDGNKVEIDVLVHCTGYDYHFPFLEEGIVETHDRRVDPLFQHIFHPSYPTLSFVGIPHSVVPFPLFELQSQWIAKIYNRSRSLPSSQEMMNWLEDHYRKLEESGKRLRDAHHMSAKQWSYCREIFEQVDPLKMEELDQILSVNEEVYNDVGKFRPKFPGGADEYRKRQYHVDRKTLSWKVEAGTYQDVASSPQS